MENEESFKYLCMLVVNNKTRELSRVLDALIPYK